MSVHVTDHGRELAVVPEIADGQPAGRSCVGKIGAKNVEFGVTVEIRDGAAHAGLGAAIFVEGCAGDNGDIGKCAVMIIVVQDAWSAIASYVNIRPAVVVVVEGGNAQ